MAKTESWNDKLAAFLARKPSLAEAQQQVADTKASIAALSGKLAEAQRDADELVLAAAEGMPGADVQRDKIRAEVRRLREDLHDAELLLTQHEERLADAKAAERQKAVVAIWDQATVYFERREDHARAVDNAVATLARALAGLNEDTTLLHVLLEGKEGWHLDTAHFRGTLAILLKEATTGQRMGIATRPLAELAADQHREIRRAAKL